MSEVKYTPGPWEAKWSKYTDGEYIVQTRHPSNRVIASFDDDGDGAGEQSIADAHLIAAAPNLLTVAKRILSRGYVSESIEEEKADHKALVAAIAKAEGRT
ncbi:hypothetical protein [Microcystis phage Mwe-JY13]